MIEKKCECGEWEYDKGEPAGYYQQEQSACWFNNILEEEISINQDFKYLVCKKCESHLMASGGVIYKKNKKFIDYEGEPTIFWCDRCGATFPTIALLCENLDIGFVCQQCSAELFPFYVEETDGGYILGDIVERDIYDPLD